MKNDEIELEANLGLNDKRLKQEIDFRNKNQKFFREEDIVNI